MQGNTFDIYAPAYDSHFTSSEIGRMQRKRVYHYFVPLLHPGVRVLELNCGTGHDAVHLSDLAGDYLATDISGEMIAQCEAKKVKAANLRFKRMAIQEAAENLKGRDIIFSNFGGFNCLSPPELSNFFRQCDAQLDRNASLFLVVMGRKCVWETVYFLLKNQWRRAFRRGSREAVPADIGGATISTWYYSPAEIARITGANYRVVSQRPVGLFVPPSYLEPFFSNKKFLLSLLYGFERLFAAPFFSNLADHFYIHLKKVR